jgi:hypothetical protein
LGEPIFVERGSCAGCEVKAYGTSLTHARKNMKDICGECQDAKEVD